MSARGRSALAHSICENPARASGTFALWTNAGWGGVLSPGACALGYVLGGRPLAVAQHDSGDREAA